MYIGTVANLALLSLLADGVTALTIPDPVARAVSTSVTSTTAVKSTTAASTLSSPTQVSSAASSALSSLTKVTPTTAAPTNAQQLNSALQGIYTANYTNLAVPVASQIAAGLISSSGSSLGSVISSLLGTNPLLPTGENSVANINLRAPTTAVYPKKGANDAPYSVTEAQLRAAIYIPSTFTYGQKPPTIFVPGTAAYGGSAFGSNLRKLLTGQTYADPVWLNIPGSGLGDVQVNSEYVAYAINYISGISQNKNVSVISWSQGGINSQWALTFFPSTRSVVSDFIPVAPDFHGTVMADVLCSSASGTGTSQTPTCAPAFLQQEYNSALITAFRAKGGAIAYVPTTTLYSGFLDEIVEPQQGTNASAFLQGPSTLVTNNEFQSICPSGSGGASFFGHATSLYNPLSYALVVDALTHDGPGLASRLNLTAVCAPSSAPGLTIADNLQTAALIPVSLVLELAYSPKNTTEPALKAYVTQ
ncbi:hypothetical protein N0V93_001774 [Gnomoniopsis smithogilvyi]|uniref:Alpha/beta-hydrolase n=1 Tax=Gnomoniopsis smithogilvyi TaxID=1191159 RepID=A0A9W8Z4F6_9PEZI|nr:hypothetical protein N0V93_001774 [Gnomoniopsis smithogilvyi]